MVSAAESAKVLREQIAATEDKLRCFREQLALVEAQISAESELQELRLSEKRPVTRKWPLASEEYKRYGRQMIVPDIGIQGISVRCNFYFHLAYKNQVS